MAPSELFLSQDMQQGETEKTGAEGLHPHAYQDEPFTSTRSNLSCHTEALPLPLEGSQTVSGAGRRYREREEEEHWSTTAYGDDRLVLPTLLFPDITQGFLCTLLG